MVEIDDATGHLPAGLADLAVRTLPPRSHHRVDLHAQAVAMVMMAAGCAKQKVGYLPYNNRTSIKL